MIIYDCCSAPIMAARNAMLRRSSVSLIGEPEAEQISLELAHSHLRLDSYGSPPGHPDDVWLETVGIPAAREYCETELGRALAPSSWELARSSFVAAIELPMSPVSAIVTVDYLDPDGNLQTMAEADYVLDTGVDPALLYLASGASWPATANTPSAVRIQYDAGYSLIGSSPNDWPLPRRYLSAMLLVLGHLYENREASNDLKLADIPLGVASLLNPTRLTLNFA